MGKLSITMASWDYDRIPGIKDGSVQVEGCEINHIVARPEETFFRLFKYQEFDVSEMSLPWLTAEAENTMEEMGREYWPYGVDPNRKTLEAQLRWAKEDRDLSYQLMRKYMRVDDGEVLEGSYVSALPTFPERAPYVSLEAIEQLIELIAVRNPKIKGIAPNNVVDHSSVKKIESEGFIEQLYGKR